MSDCAITGGSTPPVLPGAVLGLGGVERWHEVGDSGLFTGLRLRGNRIEQLPGDAILLDASSATLDARRGPGPNSFGELGGDPLVWQRCGDLPTPEVLDGSTVTPSCEETPSSLGYPLEYIPWTMESDPLR